MNMTLLGVLIFGVVGLYTCSMIFLIVKNI